MSNPVQKNSPAKSFSAVLLAGGASRRMGRDKAMLTIPGTDRVLWQKQWNVLENLQPQELFWSGPPREEMPINARVIADAIPSAGPLGGISACLDSLRSDLLVVLAVDLPHMSADFLRDLMARCSPGCGAVIRHDGFYEPLAAVYPRELRDLARGHLAQKRYALQDFVETAVQANALERVPLAERDAPLFQNLNTPSDLPDGWGS